MRQLRPFLSVAIVAAALQIAMGAEQPTSPGRVEDVEAERLTLGTSHGTLVGAFIARDGIVLAADRAISSESASDPKSLTKVFVTGPRSVAALQGRYGATDPKSGTTAQQYSRFAQGCIDLRVMTGTRISAQAAFLAAALRTQLQSFLDRVPPSDVKPFYREPRSDKHENYVVVAGYEGKSPTVSFQRLAMVLQDGRWTAFAHPSKLTLDRCGAQFAGEDAVVQKLLAGDAATKSFEAQVRMLSETRRARVGDCTLFTTQQAVAFFEDAARVTSRFGVRFGIPAGAVGGALDIYVVREGGMSSRTIPDDAGPGRGAAHGTPRRPK